MNAKALGKGRGPGAWPAPREWVERPGVAPALAPPTTPPTTPAPSTPLAERLWAVFEVAFCPAVLIGCVVATYFARRAGATWVTTLFVSSAAPLAVITVFEWLRPYRRDWNYPFREAPRAALRELGTDLLFALFITRIHTWLLPTLLPYVVPTAKVLGKKLGIYGALAGLPSPARVALLLLVGELFWYWGHRLQHTVPLLWRFHATHHVPTRLSALKAARNHPVDLLMLSVVGSLPLVALGARGRDLMWAALIQSVVNVLSHANVPVRSRGFSWLFATADYHRVHHSADERESRSNYGCRLLFWDWVFGSLKAPREGVRIGVEPIGERGLLHQMFAPFTRRPL